MNDLVLHGNVEPVNNIFYIVHSNLSHQAEETDLCKPYNIELGRTQNDIRTLLDLKDSPLSPLFFK